MEEAKFNDQLLSGDSDCSADSEDGETLSAAEDSSIVHNGALCVTEEGRLEEAPGALQDSPGRGRAVQRRVASLYTAVQRSWLLWETVLLLRLACPVVRT